MPDTVLTVLRRNLRAALQRRELEAAAALLASLEERDPVSVETRGLALEYLLAAGRVEEAHAAGQQLVTRFPASARVHYLVGRVAYARRDYAAAERALREANQLYPHWRTRRWLGKALTQLGRLDEAEAELLAIAGERRVASRDLAWLYERRGDPDRALAAIEAYLERYPDDEPASAQRLRLRGHALPPDELLEEVETLAELGEEVPPALAPTYVQRLLETGEGRAARRYVEHHAEGWPNAVATSVGWACYRLKAFDLAHRLLLRTLPARRTDPKHLAALERSARECRRLDELIARYRELAEVDPRFHGRIRTLERRLEQDAGRPGQR